MKSRSKLGIPNRQAADWLARLHADDRTVADEDAFRSWLKADQAHESAFENASALWTAVGGLRDERSVPSVPAKPLAPTMSRRTVMAGSGALIVTAGLTLGWQTAYAGVYRTSIGEQRRIVLEDGTRAMLDTDTSIRFRAKNDIRMLSLDAGRIDLDIAVDARPFVIDLGKRQASAAAARLDVRRTGDNLALTAINGTARIESTAGQPVAVSSGSRIAMMADGQDRLDRPELEDLIAWQGGRLVFRDDTLGQAIAEMNRYSHRTLGAPDPQVAALRVSGAYRVGDPEAFAHSLGVLLPVRTDIDGDVVRILAAN